jgi:hypothetical protein
VKKQKTSSQIEQPPFCLAWFWLFALAVQYLELFDISMMWIRIFSKCVFLICVFVDCSFLIRVLFRRATRPILQPQMGFMKVDPYLKEAIQVWCLFESLKDSKTKRGMIAAITQYLQAHVKESLPLYVYRQLMRIDYISDWTSDDGNARVEEMLEEAFG